MYDFLIFGLAAGLVFPRLFFLATAAGSPIGSILGLLAFQIPAAATGPDFLAWGPFLLSVVLIGIGLWVRLGRQDLLVSGLAGSAAMLITVFIASATASASSRP